MLVLIDLDGTLTDTAHARFKPFKDGLEETAVQTIPVIEGAEEFIAELQKQGHTPLIISDSHPKYVNKIAKQIFRIPALSLADKPNSAKTLAFLKATHPNVTDIKSEAVVIGDTWLDIELGRALNCPTVLTNFYTASSEESRDGIGQTWKHLKSGPTFCADKYADIYAILDSPAKHLLAAEAAFQNSTSSRAAKLKTYKSDSGFIVYRALGRQNSGESDKYAVADIYSEFQRANRTTETLQKLARSVEIYLSHVVDSLPNVHWDYITYLSDKPTTMPPNKMRELFDLIQTPIVKKDLLLWKSNVKGSIKNQPDRQHRSEFVSEYLAISNSPELKDKNIIILDDQFTTGGTADLICKKLKELQVKRIIFVTLFYLTSPVQSDKLCPICGKQMSIKIRKSDGRKFYSCTPPKYKGSGCGQIVNIN